MVGVAAVLRSGLFATMTGVQAVALVWWLRLLDGTPSTAVPGLAAPAVLFAGLLATHVLADVAVNDVNLDLPYAGLAAVSATETAAWSGWLALAGAIRGPLGVGVASAGFAALLVVQHTLESNVLRGTSPRGALVEPGAVPSAVVVAGGAAAWLALQGGGTLPVGVPAGAAGVATLAAALLVGQRLLVDHASR